MFVATNCSDATNGPGYACGLACPAPLGQSPVPMPPRAAARHSDKTATGHRVSWRIGSATFRTGCAFTYMHRHAQDQLSFWLERALEAEARAAEARNEAAKKLLRQIAVMYDAMALQVAFQEKVPGALGEG